MPKGPQGQKRPADAIGCAVMVGRIATGELSPDHKNPPKGQAGGKRGGRARAEKLSSEQRSEIAKVGAKARWEKDE